MSSRGPQATFLAFAISLTLLACLIFLSSALAAESCPNKQLRAESNVNLTTGQPYSTQLPDCRAYELVSPPNTEGFGAPNQAYSSDLGGRSAVQITKNDSVFFDSVATPAGTGATGRGRWDEVFRSRRTPDGWMTRDMVTSSTAPGLYEMLQPSTTGSSVLIATPVTLSPEDVDNPVHNPTQGIDLYVVSEDGAPQLVTHGEIQFTGTEVENPSESPLVVGLPVFANAELSAIGFFSKVSLQRPSTSGSTTTPGCYLWDDTESHLAFLTNPDIGSPPPRNCNYFAITADGRAIIEDTSEEAYKGRIFASTGGIGWTSGDTVQLSGDTPGAAAFAALSPNEQIVYLTTTDKLTPEADADVGADLYAVNLRATSGLDNHEPPTAPAVTCMSCEASGAPNSTSASWNGQSADGSHVFFTVNGTLYSYTANAETPVTSATSGLEHLTISANGQHVIAATTTALSSADVNHTSDIYEFSEAEGWKPQLVTDGVSIAHYTPIAVSDAGDQVVYEDSEGGDPTVIDELAAGVTSQISPLGAAQNYEVQGSTGPELENIFFEAHEPLVGQDENAGTTDIYDARVDGGFPAPVEPPNESKTPNPNAPAPPAYTSSLATPFITPPSLPPDTSHPAAVSKSKPLTRAQNLAKALKSCKMDKAKSKRTKCETTARKRYGAKKPTKKAKK